MTPCSHAGPSLALSDVAKLREKIMQGKARQKSLEEQIGLMKATISKMNETEDALKAKVERQKSKVRELKEQVR